MEEIAFPSNQGMPGAYTGMIPLTSPVSVSAGDGFVVTIAGTDVEDDCTGIGFEAPFICPLVCLSEIEVLSPPETPHVRDQRQAKVPRPKFVNSIMSK